MTYTETKMKYDGTVDEYDCRLLEYSPNRVVLFFPLPEDRLVDEVNLRKGDYTIAYYWNDRGYNAYHWVTPEGKTLAYYFNMAENTQIGPSGLSWRDMVVDVICYPDGKSKVLDLDELPVPLDQFEEGRIKRSLDELLVSLSEVTKEIQRETERIRKSLL